MVTCDNCAKNKGKSKGIVSCGTIDNKIKIPDNCAAKELTRAGWIKAAIKAERQKNYSLASMYRQNAFLNLNYAIIPDFKI